MSLHRVAVLVFEPVSMFEVAVACEVFGLDRSEMGVPRYGFTVCSSQPGLLATKDHGCRLGVDAGPEALRLADTIICPGYPDGAEPIDASIVAALHRAHRRGARIVSFCSGAFVLAQAGLLDGRRAATHWMYASQMARLFPQVEVDATVLYVDDGSGIYTSAGTSAAVDLCLHLVRLDHGAAVANVVARRMVVPPHRSGGQSQYVEAAVATTSGSDQIAGMLEWVLEHIDEDLTVERMADRAGQSPRTFARRFRSSVGTTPLQWLLEQRVLAARRLLEGSELPIEHVAQRVGFGSASTLRQHFGRVVGVAPLAYRRAFRLSA